jgi:hypothetical protein
MKRNRCPDSTEPQLAHVYQTRGKDKSIKREAYSPSEFAASCGRHPSWAYRLLYDGKIKALTDLGRILIPASELERLLAAATPYNPQPRKQRVRQPRILPMGRRGVKVAAGEEESEHRIVNPLLARSERKWLRHTGEGES